MKPTPTEEPSDQLINHVAMFLAAAYWRGRLCPNGQQESTPLRKAIEAAAAEDCNAWRFSARQALTL